MEVMPNAWTNFHFICRHINGYHVKYLWYFQHAKIRDLQFTTLKIPENITGALLLRNFNTAGASGAPAVPTPIGSGFFSIYLNLLLLSINTAKVPCMHTVELTAMGNVACITAAVWLTVQYNLRLLTRLTKRSAST